MDATISGLLRPASASNSERDAALAVREAARTAKIVRAIFRARIIGCGPQNPGRTEYPRACRTDGAKAAASNRTPQSPDKPSPETPRDWDWRASGYRSNASFDCRDPPLKRSRYRPGAVATFRYFLRNERVDARGSSLG